MKDIFKKLSTLPPARRATALMWRCILSFLLWVTIVICWPMFFLWSILGVVLAAIGAFIFFAYRGIRDGLTRQMTRDDRSNGRRFD